MDHLESGDECECEDENAGDKTGAFVHKPFHFRLDIKLVAVIKGNEEQLEDWVLHRIAECPVKQAAQSNKEEEVDKSRAGNASEDYISQSKQPNHKVKDKQ